MSVPEDTHSRQQFRRHPSRVGIPYPPIHRVSQGHRGHHPSQRDTPSLVFEQRRRRDRARPRPHSRGSFRQPQGEIRSKDGYFPLIEYPGLDAAIVEVVRHARNRPSAPRSSLDARTRDLTELFINHVNAERRTAQSDRISLSAPYRLRDRDISSSRKRRRSFHVDHTSSGESSEESSSPSSLAVRNSRSGRDPRGTRSAPRRRSRALSEPHARRPDHPRRAKEKAGNLNEDQLSTAVEIPINELHKDLSDKPKKASRTVPESLAIRDPVNSSDIRTPNAGRVDPSSVVALDDHSQSSSEDEGGQLLPVVLPRVFVRSRPLCSDRFSLTPFIADDDDSTDTEMKRKSQARRQRHALRRHEEFIGTRFTPTSCILNDYGVPLSSHRLVSDSLAVLHGGKFVHYRLPDLGSVPAKEMRAIVPVQREITGMVLPLRTEGSLSTQAANVSLSKDIHGQQLTAPATYESGMIVTGASRASGGGAYKTKSNLPAGRGLPRLLPRPTLHAGQRSLHTHLAGTAQLWAAVQQRAPALGHSAPTPPPQVSQGMLPSVIPQGSTGTCEKRWPDDQVGKHPSVTSGVKSVTLPMASTGPHTSAFSREDRSFSNPVTVSQGHGASSSPCEEPNALGSERNASLQNPDLHGTREHQARLPSELVVENQGIKAQRRQEAVSGGVQNGRAKVVTPAMDLSRIPSHDPAHGPQASSLQNPYVQQKSQQQGDTLGSTQGLSISAEEPSVSAHLPVLAPTTSTRKAVGKTDISAAGGQDDSLLLPASGKPQNNALPDSFVAQNPVQHQNGLSGGKEAVAKGNTSEMGGQGPNVPIDVEKIVSEKEA